jgi:hypothetical protein
MPQFKSVLYLDDLREPLLVGIDHVRNYDEFVAYLETKGMPDLISFDHDLDPEHYPIGQTDIHGKINYDSYKEKTGLHCARYIIENNLPLRSWAVHSYNQVGKANIEAELRRYRPRGEMRNLQIPFDVPEKHRHIILPFLGLAKPPKPEPCCEKDDDGDGNCPDHISPGNFRNQQFNVVRRENCSTCGGGGLIPGTPGDWDGTPGIPAHECPTCST